MNMDFGIPNSACMGNLVLATEELHTEHKTLGMDRRGYAACTGEFMLKYILKNKPRTKSFQLQSVFSGLHMVA